MPDAPNSGSNRKNQVAGLGNQVIGLLRTPMAAEAEGGVSHPDDAKAGNHALRLGGQVLALGGHIEAKLPTPQVDDSKNTGHNEKRRPTLASRVYGKTNWGRFDTAIQRWETITGRTAPAPTVPDGQHGQHRLSALFTEWLMGLPNGWITDTGLTRNEQLKACGNGVVPQQAELALRRLLDV